MSTPFRDVQEFHQKFRVRRLSEPGFPVEELELARLDYLIEEVVEYVQHLVRGDYREVVDGLTDINYIANGSMDVYGADGDASHNEVHRSNMTKTYAPGKIQKGPKWSPTNLGNAGVPAIHRGHKLDVDKVIATLAKHGINLSGLDELEASGSESETLVVE